MPSRGRKFITEFLLPNLTDKKFGSRLEWLNVEEAVFQLQWNHKSAADWKETDAEVFTEWDKMKGHYRPEDKEYYTKSKQRFRAVLYKLIRDQQITEVCSQDKSTKIYCIGKREKYELENIIHFKLHSSQSYSVESPLESVIEDHRYTQSEHIDPGNEDTSFYPTQPCSLYSPQKEKCTRIDSIFMDENQFSYQQSGQPATLHVNCFIIPKEESLSLSDTSLHQNIDSCEAGALLYSVPDLLLNYGDFNCTNCPEECFT